MPPRRAPLPSSPRPNPPLPEAPLPPPTPAPGMIPTSPLSKRFPTPASPPSTASGGCASGLDAAEGPSILPAVVSMVSLGSGGRGPGLEPPASRSVEASCGPDAGLCVGSGRGFLTRAGFGGGWGLGRGSIRFDGVCSTILGGVMGSTFGGVIDSSGGGGEGGIVLTSSAGSEVGVAMSSSSVSASG